MKGDVIPGHFLMLRFQRDSLDAIGFRTYGGGFTVLNQLYPENLFGAIASRNGQI